MPKSKKPAGGRQAKNFEPRFGEKKTSFHDRTRAGAGQKPGSKSPNHRGYRAAEEGAATGAPKTRWTATQRAGRDEARGIRTHAPGDRPARSYDARPARSNDGRPARSVDSRPARSNDRPQRSNDERPARRRGCGRRCAHRRLQDGSPQDALDGDAARRPR